MPPGCTVQYCVTPGAYTNGYSVLIELNILYSCIHKHIYKYQCGSYQLFNRKREYLCEKMGVYQNVTAGPPIWITSNFLFWRYSRVQRGGPQKRVNDRVSFTNTNYIKSTLLSFLKVCLYGYCINSSFYYVLFFCQLDMVSYQINENHF